MLEKIVTGKYHLRRKFFVPGEVRTRGYTSDNTKMITRTNLPNNYTQTRRLHYNLSIARGKSGKLFNGARYK